jgi:hypothetical protein
LLLIDPETGTIESITGIQTAGSSLSRFLRPAEVPPFLSAHRHELEAHAASAGPYGDYRDRLISNFEQRDINVNPVLFWEPCDQSLTPFKPFYKVDHKMTDRTDQFLVRVDGRTYAKTTRGGRGM